MIDPTIDPPPPTSSPPTVPGQVTHGGNGDEQHLRILAIFYFVMGGITLAGMLCSSFYIVWGVVFLMGGEDMFANDPNPPPPEFAAIMGWTFLGSGVFAAVLCLVWGGLQLYAGASLLKHRRHTFCLVVAAITCLSIPLGTILGIFTLVVLMRPGVRALFDATVEPAVA